MEIVMDGFDLQGVRGADGRFLPGCSGNPAGKRPGTRNRATLLAEALSEGEAQALIRVIVDKALAGDGVAARFCATRLLAKPRGAAIRLDIPERARPGDVIAAFNATLKAMAAGEITPEEALTVTRVLEGRMRALEAWQLERKLTWYGDPIPGDRAMMPETAESDDEDDDDDEDETEVEDAENDAGAPVTASPGQPSPQPAASPAAASGHSDPAAGGSGGLSAASLQTILSVLEAEQRRRAARRPASSHRTAPGASAQVAAAAA
jgi:hypothetical protein